MISVVRLVVAATALMLTACGSAGTSGQPSPTASPSVSPTPTASPTATSTVRPTPTVRPTATVTPTRTPTVGPTSTSALPSWLRGHVVTRLPTTRRVIALTFDGGAGAQGAAAVLATLAREGVPATFFVTADFADANRATVRTMAQRGYVVGDHTIAHPHSTKITSAALTREVTVAAQRIAAVTGRSPRPWFRFPYGEYDARTLAIVNGLGYGAIGWTVDTKGYLGKEAGSAADIVPRVIDRLQPGAIVLMHLGANPDDRTTYDADALPAVIAAVRAAGYGFVSVASAGG